MAVLFRPVALHSVMRSITKPQISQTIRTLHQTSKSIPRASPIQILSKSKYGFSRAYSGQPIDTTINSINPTAQGSLGKRLAYGGAIFAGTLLAINLVFNRETREGGIPLAERAYLNDSFLHTGLGIGIIGIGARALHSSGWSVRLMMTNPWLVMGGGLVASVATMYGAMAVDPDK